jgi:hypothetical protein
MVLGDILQDREGVLYVRYLSSGKDYCVRAAALGSGQSLKHSRQKKDCYGFVKCFFQKQVAIASCTLSVALLAGSAACIHTIYDHNNLIIGRSKE